MGERTEPRDRGLFSERTAGLIIGGEIREGFDCIVISQEWCLRAFFQALPRAAPLPPLPYVCVGVLMVFHHFFLCSSLLMPIHSPSTCPLPTFLSCHPNSSSFFFPCSYLLHLFSPLLCLALLPPTTSYKSFLLILFPTAISLLASLPHSLFSQDPHRLQLQEPELFPRLVAFISLSLQFLVHSSLCPVTVPPSKVN